MVNEYEVDLTVTVMAESEDDVETFFQDIFDEYSEDVDEFHISSINHIVQAEVPSFA